jgi:hypothetical protein
MSADPFGLGWVPPVTPDPRNWPVSRLLALVEAGEAVPNKEVKWEAPPVALNQEQTPHCAGFAAAAFKACAERLWPTDPSIGSAEGHRLYYEAKILDGAPGVEEGTSIHSIMRVLKNEGTIDAYAFGTFEEARGWMQRYGPVLAGLAWFENMFYPKPDGLVTPGGILRGGHAFLMRGTDMLIEQAPAVFNRNSWNGWGLRGDFYLWHSTVNSLAEQYGAELGMAVKFVQPPDSGHKTYNCPFHKGWDGWV